MDPNFLDEAESSHSHDHDHDHDHHSHDHDHHHEHEHEGDAADCTKCAEDGHTHNHGKDFNVKLTSVGRVGLVWGYGWYGCGAGDFPVVRFLVSVESLPIARAYHC